MYYRLICNRDAVALGIESPDGFWDLRKLQAHVESCAVCKAHVEKVGVDLGKAIDDLEAPDDIQLVATSFGDDASYYVSIDGECVTVNAGGVPEASPYFSLVAEQYAALTGLDAPEEPTKYEITTDSIMSHPKNENLLFDYLTAEWGHDLVIWTDATYSVIQTNETPQDEFIGRFKCPGINNLDRTAFTDGFCEYSHERGGYVEDRTGRFVGQFEDVIRECLYDSDMSGFYDEVREKIQEVL